MQTRLTSVGLVIQPDPIDLFAYPHHISRPSLDALPSRPGVYIFRDEHDVPLYIGKSVNIRSRVLCHLRTPQEARLLQQSRYVEFHRTAGDIGALLLESRLIKQLQPVHNKMLRRTRDMCTLRLGIDNQRGIPEIIYARDLDFSTTVGLYGLFATRKSALDKLRSLVEMHRLCPAMTGLEKVARGRACFSHQLSRCLGACVGAESVDDHCARLLNALEEFRVVVWPYAGAVGIVEECEGWKQTHVIDHWFYMGSIDHAERKPTLKRAGKRVFDVDTYKILVKPLVLGKLLIEPISF